MFSQKSGFPDGSEGKESTCNAGDKGDEDRIPGLERSPGGGNGNPLQYSWLKNPMEREVWWAAVQRGSKSQTWPTTKQECFKQSEKSDRYSLPCSFTERVCFSSDFFQNSFLIFDFLKLGYNTEKAMAPHSSTLAWKIPWMEEPGRLRSLGSRRVGYEWATSLSLFTFMHWRRKWQSTLVFLPGESQGQRSLVGCRLWGRTKSNTTEAT